MQKIVLLKWRIEQEVLKKHKLIKTNKIKDLIKADLWARQQATAIIESKKR